MKKFGKQPIDFKLYMITDSSLCPTDRFQAIIREAVSQGIKAIQLREKTIDAGSLFSMAKKTKSVCGEKTSLLVNDRVDVAIAAGANGAQLTAKSLPAKAARKIAGNNFLLGVSTHSLEEVRVAEQNGCDFVLFGPVFETESKLKYGPPQGLKKLRDVCRSSELPVFAVGGINAQNALDCIESGAGGVAVISAIMKSGNISATLNNFRNSLGTL